MKHLLTEITHHLRYIILIGQQALALGLLVLASCSFLKAQENGDKLFDNTFLHRIDLVAEGLEDILQYEIGLYEGPVQLMIDGQLVDSIAIRRKGFTSNEFNNTNPPFKIDIDGFVKDQEYDGLDIFNLHNHFTDTYYQKNALSYALYRRAGVPAPRTSFAEVYINDVFVEIYTITEDIDRGFLNQNFASKNGSLYKGIEFPIDGVSVNKGDMEAYDEYINNAVPANWSDYVDLHNFFRVIIVDDIISTDDSGQNDYMYYEPKSKKMYLVTWDHNFSYRLSISSIDTNYLLNPKIPFFTIEKSSEFINAPEIKPLYLDVLCLLTSYLLDSNYVAQTVMQNYNILQSNDHDLNIEDPTALLDELIAIRQAYSSALSELGYNNCNQLTLPFDSQDIVINEFVADSDENGVQEPNGGTPDWIELYNTSNEDITLNDQIYLSDDRDFPKKWHFSDELTVPSNGYLILWADRDVHQDGIHTNFKLKSSGEDLLLIFEDMTVLQDVNFGQQELNKASARVPNGTGAFIIQEPTFGVNNVTTTSTANQKNPLDEVILFPNPSDGVVNFDGINDLTDMEVQVFNALGQQVQSTSLTTGSISLTNFPHGMYFIRLKSQEGLGLFRVILR